MNAVLARGTWYFERKPLLGTAKNDSIPLWVRFRNLPDYYWTREGLSCVASSIGPPICADKVTSQLNPVQFAKMCVRYKLGDPLPEKIKVAVMDINSKELSPSEVAEIEVSYPQRPMVCTGCKQLGHLVGACPTVKRVWVQKGVKTDTSAIIPENKTTVSVEALVEKAEGGKIPESPPVEIRESKDDVVNDAMAGEGSKDEGVINSNAAVTGEGWTTVGRKVVQQKPSAPPVLGRADLPIFNALAKSMSKSQLKRARRAGGRNSPNKK